jgi:hypothetical protein
VATRLSQLLLVLVVGMEDIPVAQLLKTAETVVVAEVVPNPAQMGLLALAARAEMVLLVRDLVPV